MSPPPKDFKQDSTSPNASSSEKSANNQNIIKKPKRLRKQLNNREFKQYYFELVPNSNPNAEEPTTFTVHQDSYEVKKFETSHSNDEEIRNAIKAHSSHFYLFSNNNSTNQNNKKVKNATNNSTLAVTCRETSPSCQHVDQHLQHVSNNSTTTTTTRSSSYSLMQNKVYDNRQEINDILLDSKLMLTLDYDDIIDQLCNVNSPYYHSFRQFNVK